MKVGAVAAADQHSVAGEGHAGVVEHVAQAAGGVAGRGAGFEPAAAEDDAVAVAQQPAGTLYACGGRERDGAAQARVVQPAGAHVVGVHVGFERGFERKAQLAQQRRVACGLLENRVDQERVAAIGQQVGLGR